MRLRPVYWLVVFVTLVAATCRNVNSGDEVNTIKPEDRQGAGHEGHAHNNAPRPAWVHEEYDYQPSATILHNLVHTRLEVSFDWQKQWLMGKALLKLVPYFHATDSLILDAKGFTVNAVAMVGPNNTRTPLQYTYNGQELHIGLGRSYTRTDTFQIFVDYIAKPNEMDSEGGEAISDRRGLYFINPLGTEPNKPRQIWTQGETESSSCWFPTIDRPNQRCTEEIYITVDSNFTTLSNGVMVSQTQNPNGTRTDYWKMDLPHAPYLFMMAVGEFSVTTDRWNGIDVTYYVERDYGPYARQIFGNTPEMLEFYSNTFGVRYPWPKYAQVVVRDFVSGAMENTTATIHYDALHRDSRALLDETHEDIVAHELVHHWFGDLVTCESWSNLTLNEGFATFGEFLWIEHKYGADEAAAHVDRDLAAYLAESGEKREALIRYRYIHRDDMFDAHSYQKGGRVLLMLRQVLGKEAFYAGLKRYLSQHAYSPVEVAELRMAFEDVSGQDLNWFFDNWFMKPGHLELKLEYATSGNTVTIKVQQTQDTRYVPIYRMPVTAQVMLAGGRQQTFPLWLETADTTFTLNLPAGVTVTNVDFDSEHYLLAAYTVNKPKEWWIEQYRRGSNYKQKQEALSKLMSLVDDPAVAAVFREALNDPFHGIRTYALEALAQASNVTDAATLAKVREMASRDAKASVRLAAISYLTVLEFENQPEELAVVRNAVNDSSYAVAANALGTLYTYNQTEGLEAARRLKDLNSDEVRGAVADIFLTENAAEATDYVLGVLNTMGAGYEKMFLIQRFGTYLASVEDATAKQRGIDYLKNMAKNAPAWYIRFMAARTLLPFREDPAINDFLQELKRTETNPRLQEMYNSQF